LIFVLENIADAGNILPSDFLMLRFQLTIQVTAGFGNYLDPALHRRTQHP
jgi:hypothetical protein